MPKAVKTPHRKTLWHLLYWLAAGAMLLWTQPLWSGMRGVESVPYARFERALAEGLLAEVLVGDTTITGRLKTPEPGGRTAIVTERIDPSLARSLAQQGVSYTRVSESPWRQALLSWGLPAGLLLLMWVWVVRPLVARHHVDGAVSLGEGAALVSVVADEEVGLAQIAGVDGPKAGVRDLINFLKEPKEYRRLGARPPQGVLFGGPAGTGKTLMARAIAGEARVPLITLAGAEWLSLSRADGGARCQELFALARRQAPCVLFLDDLDLIGGRPQAGTTPRGRTQALGRLLAEIDRFDPSAGVVLLAAAQRPDRLEPTLLRAGRFERVLAFDRPDRIGRVHILQVHIRGLRLGGGVDLIDVAEQTAGFTGADLAQLCNEAALGATRRGAQEVMLHDFNEALQRLAARGGSAPQRLDQHERRIVAVHEIGHALVAMALPGVDPLPRVSIVPPGTGALGHHLRRPFRGRHVTTREALENAVVVLLAGGAAEQLVLGDLSSGSADDLAAAGEIARDLVTRHGLVQGGADKAEEAVRVLLAGALGRALQILQTNRRLLDHCTQELLARETIDDETLRMLTREMQPQ